MLTSCTLSITTVTGMGEIAGRAMDDSDANGSIDGGEQPITGRSVYLDLNGNGSRDANEPEITTDADGGYHFYGLPAGDYTVRQELPPNWLATAAAPAVHLAFGQIIGSQDLLSLSAGSIHGTVFEDTNRNGLRNSYDPLADGVKVYLDTNGNGKLDAGEPTAITDAAGAFTLGNLLPGHYSLRHAVPTGMQPIAPAGAVYAVDLAEGQSASGYSFADNNPNRNYSQNIVIPGIANNAIRVSAANGTDFGQVRIAKGGHKHSVIIRNSGWRNLLIKSIKVIGDGSFRVLAPTPTKIVPHQAATFEVVFMPRTAGIHKATIVITSNDPDEKVYRFVVRGVAIA